MLKTDNFQNKLGLPVWLLAFYLIAFFLWPFYIDVRVQENVGLNPERVILLCMVLILFLEIFSFKQKTVSIVFGRYYKPIFFLAVVYLGFRYFTSLYNNSFYSFSLALYESLSCFVLALYVIVFVRNHKSINFIMSIIFYCALIVALYGLVERYFEFNIFSTMADINTIAGFTAASEKYRDGAYRIQSTFEHPLSLVQMMSLSLPLAYFRWKIKRRALEIGVFILAMLGVVYFAGSRSSMVVIAAEVLVFIFLLMWFRRKEISKNTGSTGLAYIAVAAIFVIVVVVFVMATLGGSESEERSSLTRVAQINNGYIAIIERPIVGYGIGSAPKVIMGIGDFHSDAEKIWNETVDNLFLSKAIESGVLSLLVFLAFIYYSLKKIATSVMFGGKNEISRAFGVSIFISIIGCMILMSILSIFTVIPLLFCLIGLGLVMARLEDGKVY